MPRQTSDYWLGSLAMTVALANREKDPKPILRSAWREFVADQGRDHPLVQHILTALGEKR